MNGPEDIRIEVECIPESVRTAHRPRPGRRSAKYPLVIDRLSTSQRRSVRRTSRVGNDSLLQEIQSRITAGLSAVLLWSQEVEARLARLHPLAGYQHLIFSMEGGERPTVPAIGVTFVGLWLISAIVQPRAWFAGLASE
ncbi:hypothetical protein QAD02_020920 [Eretmocerus hayati]|uniref:Uncharacterized protein n=1 Tax=Eretmocerus hayati TaxID=131215 RepID=A0ACC2PNY8_9HYME|nr:hypothetical protein QAD02_020920 [Eretmocerus hayati]